MRKLIFTIVAIVCFINIGMANESIATETLRLAKVGDKVENVNILNLDGEDAVIPWWGDTNLMIFYVDPDKATQNKDFCDELERSKRAESPNIKGLGVINLKDAPFIPNRLARMMANKRTEKNGATVLADQERTLSTEWRLGDCNNQFVLIILSREGEILYLRKGILSEQDKSDFMDVIERIK